MESGVKVKGAYYCHNLLDKKLLPGIFRLSQGGVCLSAGWCIVHRARHTVVLLQHKEPDFIPPTLWPPNSLDLNQVDYNSWSVLQEKVYQSRIANVKELKMRLIHEWARFDQSSVDAAIYYISQRSRRLSACVRSAGHTLSTKYNVSAILSSVQPKLLN